MWPGRPSSEPWDWSRGSGGNPGVRPTPVSPAREPLCPQTAPPGSRGPLAGRGRSRPGWHRGGPPRPSRRRAPLSHCRTAGPSPRPPAGAPGARARGAGAGAAAAPGGPGSGTGGPRRPTGRTGAHLPPPGHPQARPASLGARGPERQPSGHRPGAGGGRRRPGRSGPGDSSAASGAPEPGALRVPGSGGPEPAPPSPTSCGRSSARGTGPH